MGKKNKGMKADKVMGNMPKGPVPMPTSRGAVPMMTGNAGFGLAKGGSVPTQLGSGMKMLTKSKAPSRAAIRNAKPVAMPKVDASSMKIPRRSTGLPTIDTTKIAAMRKGGSVKGKRGC